MQALTAADVGVAMGSGSDIALSSAKFVLLSSDLNTLLVLSDLSRKVFRRIKFNFVSLINASLLRRVTEFIYRGGHWSTMWSRFPSLPGSYILQDILGLVQCGLRWPWRCRTSTFPVIA